MGGSVPMACDTFPTLASTLAGAMAPALVLPPPATDVAFFVVFGLFVVAMVVLVALIIVRAVRHDVIGRRAWRARQEAAWQAREEGDPLPPPQPRLRARQRPPRSQP
jgi:hypothetical protein